MNVKYLTKDTFTKLNARAIRRDANRTLETAFIENLDEDFKYPIVEEILHNELEMRCQIAFNNLGETCWLDIPLNDFNNLPEVWVGDNA